MLQVLWGGGAQEKECVKSAKRSFKVPNSSQFRSASSWGEVSEEFVDSLVTNRYCKSDKVMGTYDEAEQPSDRAEART